MPLYPIYFTTSGVNTDCIIGRTRSSIISISVNKFCRASSNLEYSLSISLIFCFNSEILFKKPYFSRSGTNDFVRMSNVFLDYIILLRLPQSTPLHDFMPHHDLRDLSILMSAAPLFLGRSMVVISSLTEYWIIKCRPQFRRVTKYAIQHPTGKVRNISFPAIRRPLESRNFLTNNGPSK
jgi:hypothetical protein